MKLAFAVVVAVMACVGATAQYDFAVPPPPSMNAAYAGMGAGFTNPMGVPVPAAPVLDMSQAPGPMYGAPYGAFVEQQQQAMVPQQLQQQQGAPDFSTEEAETEEEETTEEEEGEEVASEDASEEAEADEARFMEKPKKSVGKKLKGALKKAKKAAKKAAKKLGKKLKKMGKKALKGLKKLAKTLAGKKRQNGKGFHRGPNGKLVGPNGKPLFKPNKGKPNNSARSPSAKTPKAAGGKKLPPMPAPLPKKFKISCKLNPALCIDAETPAEGEEPGDHSPKAIFKKKMEVIKKSLMLNNRNIAQESKWIDQVELIVKQYQLKVKKVKEHIADERKAIKELLRQRRIIINEKRQKELEQKLKMATAELTSLTDALGQVQTKEKELQAGKGQLGKQIASLATGLKTLRTNNEADKKDALKKADF